MLDKFSTFLMLLSLTTAVASKNLNGCAILVAGLATSKRSIRSGFGCYQHGAFSLTKTFCSSTESAMQGEGGDSRVGGNSIQMDAEAINNIFAEYKNKNNINDQVFSAISSCGGVKVTVATVRNLLNDVMIQHSMTATPADALGRLLTCAVLMSNGMQDEQTVQISTNADGPIRGMIAISSGSGNVKGLVGSPMLGDMPVDEAVGKGVLQIVKNHPDWPKPYNGITSIRYGDLDRDVGVYLAESEQRSCALAAATTINGILCTSAGGYLVEQLPDVEEETIEQVEQNLKKLVEMDGGDDRLPSKLLMNGMTPVEIAGVILEGLDMKPLQQIEPKVQCDCSEERLFRALRLLPRSEVDEILAKEEKIEARCDFCGKMYVMDPADVLERFSTASGDPSKDDDFLEEKET